MSRPSTQEQSLVVDCRTCVYCTDLVEGESCRCAKKPKADAFPWEIVTACPCDFFAPAPSSPPVSADREGTDVFGAARGVASWDWPAILLNDEDAPEILRDLQALDRAITAEEDRRTRPAAEDPRDATISDLRALLSEVATDVRNALEQLHDPPGPVHCNGEHDVGHAAAILRSTRFALRSAGVEPNPGAAQGGTKP